MNYWIKCLKYLNSSKRMSYVEFIKKQIKCITLVAISSISTVLFPSLVSKIIDYGIGKEDTYNIYIYCICLGITGIMMLLSEYAYQMFFYRFSQKFMLEIKELFLDKLLKTNINFWSKHTVGDMFKILEDDIATIESLFTSSISGIVSNTFIIIGVASYLIYIHKLIGILLIIFTVIIVMFQKKYGKKIENFVYPLREEVAFFSSYTNEVLNNIINIEMNGNAKKVYKEYCEKNHSIVNQTLKQLKMVTFLKSIISSYSVFGLFIVMIIGAYAVINEEISVGGLVSLTMYIQWLLGPVAALGNQYVEFKSNIPIFKRIFDVMDSEDIVYEGNVLREKMQGSLELIDVSFGYTKNKKIFDNFNLQINSGEVIGIIGKNGCGKTTIFRLLMKLCEVNTGYILIDGLPIKEYKVDYLVQQIGCLLQEEFMISGTLRSILDLEGENPDQTILTMMNDFCLEVSNFPNGLDTMIKENNSNLSGGQVQKIALVRLFLQDKAIYLLDEPTAAIDVYSESKICKSIKKYLNNKTALIITHREEILSICDRKILID